MKLTKLTVLVITITKRFFLRKLRLWKKARAFQLDSTLCENLKDFNKS